MQRKGGDKPLPYNDYENVGGVYPRPKAFSSYRKDELMAEPPATIEVTYDYQNCLESAEFIFFTPSDFQRPIILPADGADNADEDPDLLWCYLRQSA